MKPKKKYIKYSLYIEYNSSYNTFSKQNIYSKCILVFIGLTRVGNATSRYQLL